MLSSKAFVDLIVWIAVTRLYKGRLELYGTYFAVLFCDLIDMTFLELFLSLIIVACSNDELSAQANSALLLEFQSFINAGILRVEQQSETFTDPKQAFAAIPVRLQHTNRLF
jgi:hypothetical protein